MGCHRRWDYASLLPRIRYQSETEKILKKGESSFEELLLQSQIRKNGEVEEENSAEFDQRFRENENNCMACIKILIRNPICLSHKPFSLVLKKINDQEKTLPNLFHQTESLLLTFIDDPRFKEYFLYEINKASFYYSFPSMTILDALGKFKPNRTDF